ncbi:retinal maintenance-domain-containing protein [Pelagophyceae sp. CCMP2097]|nr:retinal maintenance-domain-containing protein [Pelagophyceae sp. CCMP2097]|mmetsp:Transcript_10258/g.33961  ORF Transcript_10258/g.33961 Transcript_10258/m.33961 type:complete len:321 (+) Transcript_10258:53-1015(+)
MSTPRSLATRPTPPLVDKPADFDRYLTCRKRRFIRKTSTRPILADRTNAPAPSPQRKAQPSPHKTQPSPRKAQPSPHKAQPSPRKAQPSPQRKPQPSPQRKPQPSPQRKPKPSPQRRQSFSQPFSHPFDQTFEEPFSQLSFEQPFAQPFSQPLSQRQQPLVRKAPPPPPPQQPAQKPPPAPQQQPAPQPIQQPKKFTASCTSLSQAKMRASPVRRAKVLLGGARFEDGAAPSLIQKVVSQNLRCTKCACAVARFRGFEWRSDVGYMHFRNFYPDEAKLLERSTPSSTAAAYCCQCTWISLGDEIREISNCHDSQLNWANA